MSERDWWRGALIYQVYPRSFQDSNGDGIGDLPGIISRLEHVASLGADAVWLSPIFPSPMEDMGYDVSNYIDVDPLFGSLEDFDSLIKRANDLGLKVIIDQVLSHTSDEHPWFRESRLGRDNAKADWYVWSDPLPDGSPPNNWPSVFGGRAWEWNSTRRQYYLHNFLVGQPDLNFHNRQVQDAALEIMRFWLERGVDGFRFDTVNFYFHDEKLRSNPALKPPEHLPYAVNPYDMQLHKYSKNQPENIAFLKRVRKLMDAFPGTTTVGEVGEAHRAVEIMAEYTSGGDKLHMCYSFEFLGEPFSPEHFRSRVEGFFKASKDGWPCWSFSNHDVIRHLSRWAEHSTSPADLGRMAAALLMSLKGPGRRTGPARSRPAFRGTDRPARHPLLARIQGARRLPHANSLDTSKNANGFSKAKPWLPIKPNLAALNVASQDADKGSLLNYYRAFIAWRRGHDALVSGDITFLRLPDPLLAYRRSAESGNMLCVFNLSREGQNLNLGGLRDGGALEPVSHNAQIEGGVLSLGPNGVAFIAEAAGSKAVKVSVG